MQRSDRTSAMMNFKEKPEVSVILISLKAGGVGLNLTSAQRVYLMDPHWYVNFTMWTTISEFLNVLKRQFTYETVHFPYLYL